MIKPDDLREVYIDTTVRPKNIAYPTDSKLLNTGRRWLVRVAHREGIKIRQTYKRLGEKALRNIQILRHRKDNKGARRYLRKLKTYLGRVTRDIERKVKNPSTKLTYLLGIAKKLLERKKHSKNKIYSIHAPEVQCIARGKAHKKYEFGSKLSIATSTSGNWIVGMHSFLGNPFDGHTIPDALVQIQKLTGNFPNAAYCDRGYRGSDGLVFSTHVFVQGSKKYPAEGRRAARSKSRSAIEPVIGHLKTSYRMDRNFLAGFQGDQINALMAGCGFNLRKLINSFVFGVFEIFLADLMRFFLPQTSAS